MLSLNGCSGLKMFREGQITLMAGNSVYRLQEGFWILRGVLGCLPEGCESFMLGVSGHISDAKFAEHIGAGVCCVTFLL